MEIPTLYICLCAAISADLVAVQSQVLLGSADVRITNAERCPDADRYKYPVEVARRKLSRTTDAFSFNLTFDRPLDDRVGIYVNLAKLVDGGYKPNAYEMTDTDACAYIMRHARESFSELLRKAGVEPGCPVPPGAYEVTDYTVDYDTMPDNLLYGDFRLDAYLTEDDERVLCLRAYVVSQPKDRRALG